MQPVQWFNTQSFWDKGLQSDFSGVRVNPLSDPGNRIKREEGRSFPTSSIYM
jgi:hypothetical protein